MRIRYRDWVLRMVGSRERETAGRRFPDRAGPRLSRVVPAANLPGRVGVGAPRVTSHFFSYELCLHGYRGTVDNQGNDVKKPSSNPNPGRSQSCV